MNATTIPVSPETVQNITNEVVTAAEAAGGNYFLYIIVAIVLAIVFLMMKKGKSKSSKSEICLVGERGSGKTQLFVSLCNGKSFETVPSISNNISTVEFGRKTYQLCDFIGDNLSKEEIVNEIARFHTLVHVIDGTDSKKLGDAALFIYKVLISKQYQKESCNYIIFFNKSDSSSFHGEEKLIKRIED